MVKILEQIDAAKENGRGFVDVAVANAVGFLATEDNVETEGEETDSEAEKENDAHQSHFFTPGLLNLTSVFTCQKETR